MLFNLFLLFTLIPALELMLLIKVGSHIGAFNTVALIFITGAAGAALARMEGFIVMRNIQNSLNQGRLPTDEMLNGFMIFCGGLLLLTPGLITDVIGFLLLIPVTRNLIKIWVRRRMQTWISDGTFAMHSTTFRQSERPSKPKNRVEDAEYY